MTHPWLASKRLHFGAAFRRRMQTRTEFVGAARKQWLGALLAVFLCINLGHIASAGIFARSQIIFYGGTNRVDSFDSSTPLKSTNGQYDSQKAGSNGGVFSINGPILMNNSQVIGAVRTNSFISFPFVGLPTNVLFSPAGGYIATPTATNTSSISSEGDTLPSNLNPDQTLVVNGTNSYTVFTNDYPGDQYGLKTNHMLVITGTNYVVYPSNTNYICGVNQYRGSSLPSNYCSYSNNPTGGYSYTLIVGTNITYSTNKYYTWTTNIYYTYLRIYYSYTVYTTNIVYQNNYYDHILCGDPYVGASLSGLTYVMCPSRMVVTNGFLMGGDDSITIASGGSLTLCVGGGDCSIETMNILNKTGYATNFVVYCANDVAHLALNGNFNFSGVVIAPNGQTTINPSGSLPLEFSGLLMVDSLVVNGNLNFHFDESLWPYAVTPAPIHPRQLANGAFSFSVGGVSGISYVVQASTNLVDWVPVVTNVGPFNFSDTNPAASDRRFYRVMWP